MDDNEILKKSIEKAQSNGWNTRSTPGWGLNCEQSSYESEGDCIYTNIFNHGFAKAFWGEGFIYDPYVGSFEQATKSFISWQYHLQQMVLEPEPLKYLEKFL